MQPGCNCPGRLVDGFLREPKCCRRTTPAQNFQTSLDPPQKQTPSSLNAIGVCKCLPQLVGSYIRVAMGCRGDGDRRPDGPIKSKLRCETSPHSVASGISLKGIHLTGVTSVAKAHICRGANRNQQRYCSANENPRHGYLHQSRQHVPMMSA